MGKVLKALRWFAVEYLKAALFFAIIGVILVSLMTFIAYPVQTITFAVISLIVLGSFFLIYDED